MTITIPDDLVPWPDAEQIIVATLDQVAQQMTPQPWVGTWIPDDYETQIQQAPLIVVQRTTGAADINNQVDVPLVEIGVLAETRADAQKINSYLRAWMLDVFPTHPQVPVRIVSITERVGSVMPPWINPDHRYVNALYEITIRRPRSHK